MSVDVISSIGSPLERREPATRAVDSSEEPSSSISKVLAILDTFSGLDTAIGVSEVARRADLSKSTAFRLLRALVRDGYVERCGVSDYRLTNRLFELGQHVWHCQPNNLRDNAVPYLIELTAQTSSVVHLAVLDATEVLYLEKLHRQPNKLCPTRVGGRMPARSTALGKALLAHSHDNVVEAALRCAPRLRTRYTQMIPDLIREQLAATARDGIAFDREEVRLGLTCVAAPIIVDGVAVAAISVSSDTAAGDPGRAANRVLTTAAAIAAQIDRSAW